MKISIIVPTYNRANLIGQTIKSVVAQTSPAWELVIVDDHSTDDTEAIVLGYQEHDSRIKFIKRSVLTKGAPACRNEGVRASSGELLVFLDSDDFLAPPCVEQRISFMAEHSDVEMLVNQSELFHENPGDLQLLVNRFDYDNDLDHFLMNDNIWLITGATWRREAFERVGYWDEALPCWQDWEQHIRALAHGIRYEKVDVVDSYLRQGQSGRQAITSGHGGQSPAYIRGAILAARKVLNTLAAAQLLTPKRRELIAFNVFEMLHTLAVNHTNKLARKLAKEAWQATVFNCREFLHCILHSLMFSIVQALERDAEWWEHRAYSYARAFRPTKMRNKLTLTESNH